MNSSQDTRSRRTVGVLAAVASLLAGGAPATQG